MNDIIDTSETLITITIPKIMTTEEVLEALGNISRSAFYRGTKAGHYPKPFKPSSKLNGSFAKDIGAIFQQGG